MVLRADKGGDGGEVLSFFVLVAFLKGADKPFCRICSKVPELVGAIAVDDKDELS